MASRRLSFGSVSPLTFAAFAALAGCGDGGTSSNGGPPDPFGTPPASLVSTCGQLCNQVLAQCDAPVTVYNDCLSACQDLSLVETTCLSELTAYITCLSGATSIQCEAGGEYVLVSPPSCGSQREAFGSCTGGPPLAACAQLPPTSTCGGAGPIFCVGQPSGCASAGSTPFGIGPYCCSGPALQ